MINAMFLRYQALANEAGTSFFAGRFREPTFNYPYHFHPEVEIQLFEKGFCTQVAGDKAFHATRGDLFVIGSSTPHFTHNNPEDSKGANWAGIALVLFHPDLLAGSPVRMPEFEEARRFLRQIEGGAVQIKGGLLKKAAPLVASLPERKGLQRVIGLLEILNLLSHGAAADLPAIVEKPQLPAMHQQDIDRLTRFFRYAHSHLNEAITLEGAAKVAGMAPSSFSRFFHKKTGQTFQQYLTKLRLDAACIHLIQTDKTVTEICYESGFNNLSNFNRQFLKRESRTPVAFRSAFRKSKE